MDGKNPTAAAETGRRNASVVINLDVPEGMSVDEAARQAAAEFQRLQQAANPKPLTEAEIRSIVREELHQQHQRSGLSGPVS